MNEIPFKLQTLKKRADFLRLRKARYFAAAGLILQAAPARSREDEDEADARDPLARFGFTATKKLGNAVARNRIKRRLREAVRQIAPHRARPSYEYVLIGRKSTLKRPFSALLKDLAIAFDKVHGECQKTGHMKQRQRRGPSRKGGGAGKSQRRG